MGANFDLFPSFPSPEHYPYSPKYLDEPEKDILDVLPLEFLREHCDLKPSFYVGFYYVNFIGNKDRLPVGPFETSDSAMQYAKATMELLRAVFYTKRLAVPNITFDIFPTFTPESVDLI